MTQFKKFSVIATKKPKIPVPGMPLKYPETYHEAIVYYIATLDSEMLHDILDDTRAYQDMFKEDFIKKIDLAFERFKQAGDTILEIYPGACSSCNKGVTGFSFVGKSGLYMNILFKFEGSEIVDIFECHSFKNCHKVEGKSFKVWIDNPFRQ